MGKFDKVLLASDFDGTLKNDNGEIDKCVLAAIEYFKANGGYFTLSTGRSLQGLCLYDLSYVNAPALLANGAMAHDIAEDKTVFLDGIDEGGCEFVQDICSRFTGLSIEMYSLGSTYAINPADDTHRHFSNQGIIFNEVLDPSDAPRPWVKVMISGDRRTLMQLQIYMSCKYKNPTFLATTGSIVEILAAGVDKGSGLIKLADYLDVPHDRVYAAGDGYNDVEMLAVAKGAFVPENGAAEAKQHADYIVRSNNDGAIANAIEILDRIY